MTGETMIAGMSDALAERFRAKYPNGLPEVPETKTETKPERFEDGYDVGDIVDESWGYDQTNVDFYRIVKRTAKTVWLEHIPTSVVYRGGPGGDKVVAGTDRLEGYPWYGKVIRRKLHFNADGTPMGLSVRGFGWASTWSGKPVYQTDPMFGH